MPVAAAPPILALVLVAIFIGCALDPAFAKSIEGTLSGIGGSVLSGPVNTVVNAWMKVAVIGAGLVLGVWVLETKIAKHEKVAGPNAPDARAVVQEGPVLRPSGGYSVGSGGVSATGGFSRVHPVVLPVAYRHSSGIGRRRAA